ncbi:hypothetical protein GALMADRAFT_251356 [Galerina marginata CBS 339.88]|uniref:Uncharacterized protein n=1 Tax=Galerina marginata (strain CBS 339.88) TaxID=685588 RepID=A0A067T105_GALM3|nr:hypothetical protein GALMADRAFT_251356 [Galerina marginata CBS 339.88]
MYSDPNNLDAPPPQSHFRRPWSPEAFDPYTPSSNVYEMPQNGSRQEFQQHEYQSHGTSPHRQQRREASEVSVEALDLADYARTLRLRQAEDPYPPFPSQIRPESHPPSAFPGIPMTSWNSRSSLPMQPPSLVSRGTTLSSNTTHHTTYSNPSRGRQSSRRPYSVPTPLPSSSHASSSRVQLPPPSAHRGPYIVDPDIHSADEIDISHFPKWSRNWYNSNNPSRYNPDSWNPPGEPDADIYSPLPTSQLNGSRSKKSPFDPGYVHDPYRTFDSDPYNAYDPPPPLSSVGHGSSRDLLPWSTDPPEYGPPLDPTQKEERIRMLQREFGGKGKGKGRDEGRALVDDEGKPLVGTIDEKGNLVTVGPKRRIFFRTLQIFLAIGACIPAIYAAVAIKTTGSDGPPPPANKPPVFVLYILSIITLLLLLYMFVVRPCCCVRSKSRSSKHPLGSASHMGMMVLPVGNAGKKNKKPKGRKKGKGKYGPPGQGDVQVNLIVDPTAFQPPDASESESEDEHDSLDEAMMPGGYDHRQQQARRKKKNRNRRRRGLVEGLKMEEEWTVARQWAKKLAMLDVAGIVLWGAAFVFIMTGKKCPSGGFNGWCNAYNTSTASACLLCVAFGVTTFFDVQDLHASKQNPRTRTS